MQLLVRFAAPDGPRLGLMRDGQILSSALSDQDWPDQVAAWMRGTPPATAGQPFDAAAVTLLPPLTQTSRVFCVAQNYPAHAAEAGGASPPTPVVFLKPTSAFVGHNSDAVLPAASGFFDYEGEIAVVIGRAAAAVSADEANDIIAGYTAANDGSARDLQPATLADRFQVDWFAAKSSDRGSALGPGVLARHNVRDPSRLSIRTVHNGEVVQDDTAGSMFHPVNELVAFISRIVALRPGDVILTGTPAGVGKARGVRLADGDYVEVLVDGVGGLRTRYTTNYAARSAAVPRSY